MKISAILLAAGKGERLKKSKPKAFVKVEDKEMFLHSLETFSKCPSISEVILVLPKAEIKVARKLLADFPNLQNNLILTSGGKSRMESLASGLKIAKNDWILSHNAANPFATNREISRLVKVLQKYDAAGVAHRADSTVRQESKILDRRKIWLMETPQICKKEFLKRGLQIAHARKIEATDELALAELAGAKIKIIAADSRNRKITRVEDLPSENRIGFGHDSHRFSKKRKALFLGGVKISANDGLEGNSDGDVILHALTNAISAALGGGSLSNFSDEMCARGIRDSKKYLKVMSAKMKAENFQIENLTISIEGKRPKLEKHFPKIRKSLSGLLSFPVKKIGIVATTGEGLTAFGRGEGLQVFAVVLLKNL